MQSAQHDAWEQARPLVALLRELRNRVLMVLGTVTTFFLALIWFANPIYTYVSAPLRDYLPEGATMIATDVTSPFLTPFKMVLVLSLFLSVPVILHQIWCLLSRGAYSKHRGVAAPLLISSVILFYLGVLFAYFVVFPLVFAFFTGVGPEGVTVMTDINLYLNFIIKLFFAFGLAFEIPVATVLLVWAGITTPRRLRMRRPQVIVGCFVAGMLLTPPDVLSQTLLAAPMWLLYEAGILAASLLSRARLADAT